MEEEPLLNYMGEWTRGGYTSLRLGSNFEIPRMEMWDFLTLFQYMTMLSNIQAESGRSVTSHGEKLGKVLEVGADWGHAWPALKSCFDEVYGLEKEEWAVKQGVSHGRNIVVGVIDSLPFEDGMFDAVVSAHTLEHGESAEQILSEILRVTKPGGWSVHRLPCTHDNVSETASWFHSCCHGYKEWRRLFQEAGFDIITDYFGWATNIEEWIIVGRKPNV